MGQNEHISDFLNYYCNLTKEPQYAVLLTGSWGSGKTWYIKNFIATQFGDSKEVLYLSLYGMQSFDDIESELFRLLHPILGSKPVRILYRLMRGAIKTSFNFDLDGDKSHETNISGEIPAEKFLEKISLNSKHILVLDDVERCSIETPSLLGYVNQFIEHGGIKAILIANEEELIKQNEDKKYSYSKTKEKVIGRTFEVTPETSSAIESFSNELPNQTTIEIVKKNFEAIQQVYDCSQFKNLRLVRNALWEFDRILKVLDEKLMRSDELISDFLSLYLVHSLEINSGSIKPSEIKKLNDRWSPYFRKNNEENPDKKFHEIQEKYSRLNLYNNLIQDQTWESIFSTGAVPRRELNESLLKSKYFQNENQPNWVKLWYGTDLSDEEFSEVLVNVQEEWNSREFTTLGEVIHVAGLFVHYAEHGLYNKTTEEIIESAKNYIDYLTKIGKIPVESPNSRPSPFEMDSYGGLGFSSLKNEKFIEFIKYIMQQKQKYLESSLPIQAKKLLSMIGNETNLFYQKIVLNNHPENEFFQTPILHLIPAEEFVKKLLESNPNDRRTVAYAIKKRYSIEQFNSSLLIELDWLRTIANLLQKESELRAGKVSSLSIKWIVDPYIIDAISELGKIKSTTQTSREDLTTQNDKT